jgi:hypothetical protein
MFKLSSLAWLSFPLVIVACGGGASGADDGAGDTGASGGSGGSAVAAGGSGTGAAKGGTGNTPTGGMAGTSSPAAGGASNGGQSAGGMTGSAGKGGTTGSAGGTGSAGSTSGANGPDPSCKPWPAATGTTQKLSKTVAVSKDYDGKLQRFVSDGLGDGAQGENQLPLFQLSDGATLENVIIGAPAADGIHCSGTCTLKNVWWEDVGEDAATLKGSSSSQVMTIDCGGAKLASDKVFQHDGPGTMKISNFYFDTFGKVYRSCGNCSKQYTRHVVISAIQAKGGSVIAGVNENYNDTATFSNVFTAGGTTICQRFTGNDTGAEPPKTGSGPDGKVCIYQATDIHGL